MFLGICIFWFYLLGYGGGDYDNFGSGGDSYDDGYDNFGGMG